MQALEWQKISEEALARLLSDAELKSSTAVGNGTLYQLLLEGQEQIVISLPAGEVVLIKGAVSNTKGRRKVDIHEG